MRRPAPIARSRSFQLENHSLFATLRSLTGNPRGCVYTEPLWGIPFNLYSPYISICMVALGLSDTRIGLIVSISWAFQVVFALLSGAITDKLGRRRTTLLFDIVGWSVPALISALAQNFWFFLAAGVINSTWRITMNSWSCLLVEDAEPEQLVDMYTWISISNQLVGLIAPLAGAIIGVFSLVPTMRGLYIFAAVMFTLKPIVTYWMTQETAQGKVRMDETRTQSVFALLGEYRHVVRDLLRAPQTLYTAGITLILSITTLISGNFWAIILTEKLHIPPQNLGAFPLSNRRLSWASFCGDAAYLQDALPATHGARVFGYIASEVLLITAPDQGYLFLVASAFLEACSFAVISPLIGEMTVLTIDPKERASIQSIPVCGRDPAHCAVWWIAGTLSGLNKNPPFYAQYRALRHRRCSCTWPGGLCTSASIGAATV